MDFLGLDDFLLAALREDIGTGDITTESCIEESARSRGKFIAKEHGIICGLTVAKRVFELLSPDITMTLLKCDGDLVGEHEVIAEIEGPSRFILGGERVALNLMQRLSGISTRTAEAVSSVSGTKAQIVDTRKSTPGLRELEKYAVRTGGGKNHRFNLSDGILIKDNHISAAGGIIKAVEAVRKNAPHTLRIEVEASNIDEVKQALSANAEIIMLDNMSIDEMRQAVTLIDGAALVEASGNMGDRDLYAVAMTGVDLISMGSLTHSIRSLDISLKFYG